MNKKVLTMLAILLIPTVFALAYYGQVQRTVTISEAVTFTGENAVDVSVSAGENVVSSDLNIKSETSVMVPLDILTEHTMNGCTIIDTENFLLSASGVQGTDSTIYITAEDVSITTLDDLDTIEWEANVDSGYLPHVDVRLDNGEILVFEYAKVNPVNCDNTPYPTGELNTFGDEGSIDDSSYAWLSSGVPGPCGDAGFDANHKSLADWKSQWGNIEVIAFEVEVDNWIADSDSNVKNILINNNPIEVSLKPSEELSFNVESEYDLLCAGEDTVTTTVTVRN